MERLRKLRASKDYLLETYSDRVEKLDPADTAGQLAALSWLSVGLTTLMGDFLSYWESHEMASPQDSIPNATTSDSVARPQQPINDRDESDERKPNAARYED